VIDQFAAIAAKYNVEEGVFIKDAFYHMVHPPNSKVNPRIKPDVMRAEMKRLGLPEASEKKKRQYTKREREG
jgi:hypothetical protein